VDGVTKEAFGLGYYNIFIEVIVPQVLRARKPLIVIYLRKKLP
jgi:hypothetical protein